MEVKKIISWFIEQTNVNKVVILFIAINVFLYIDNKDLKNQVKTLTYGQKYTDSVYVDRLNRLNRDFQQKIDDCNNERIETYLRQSEMWQKKFDQLFKETDQVYQKYQQVIQDR